MAPKKDEPMLTPEEYKKKYPWAAAQLDKAFAGRVTETAKEKKARLAEALKVREQNRIRGLKKRRKEARDKVSRRPGRPTNAERIAEVFPKRRVYVPFINGVPGVYTGKYYLPATAKPSQLKARKVVAVDSMTLLNRCHRSHKDWEIKKKGEATDALSYQIVYVELYPVLPTHTRQKWVRDMLKAAEDLTASEILTVPGFVADLVKIKNAYGKMNASIRTGTRNLKNNKPKKRK